MSNFDSSRMSRRQTGMSYKFQRLREKVRQAVVSGELAGKLPGERELARRFHVNAKTLSKALTDLAAEGILQRSIGRGTFVKGSAPEDEPLQAAWLLIVDKDVDPGLIQQMMSLNAKVETVEDIERMRPSFLSAFTAVIDLATNTPEAMLRNLLVRNIAVVRVGHEPLIYSTNAVLLDDALAVSFLAREMILAGHRHFVANEGRNQTRIAQLIHREAVRYACDVTVDAAFSRDVPCAREYGATACICDSSKSATETLASLNTAGVSVPRQMSVAAIGWDGDYSPCTGYYVSSARKAAAVAEILARAQPGRPSVLWLAGTHTDRGTIAAIPRGSESLQDSGRGKLLAASMSGLESVVSVG